MAQPQLETMGTPPNDNRRLSSGWLLLIAVLVIGAAVLVGLFVVRGDSTPSAEGVRDFSDIQASEITFEFDAATGTAVLHVSTTEDAACSIVYGPTTDFGSIATDTDMAGGGHATHQPSLVGLEPGATYWYRLQGTADDGSLFQSDALQFTFPTGSATAAEPPAPNVADMAMVTDVSSEFSDAFAGSNAIDGDLATEWSSAGDGDDAFIELDFGQDMTVAGVGYRTREMSDGTSIVLTYTVTVDDEAYGPFPAGPGLAIEPVDFEGRVIRFDVDTSTGGNTGAVEIEVYGEPGR